MSLKVPEKSDHPSKWSAKDPWKDVKHTPGAFPSSPQPEHDLEFLGQRSLASAVRERRHDYIRKRNIKIKIGTWNVAAISDTCKDLPLWFVKGLGVKGLQQDLAGLSLSDSSDDYEEIEPIEQQESRSGRKQSTVPVGEVAAVPSDDDIGLYALGLQEVIDITSITEAMRPYYDPHPGKKWMRAVKRNIPHGYVKIAEQQLLGLLVLIFASPEVAPQVTSVSCQSVGTGAFGYVGNKGAVSVRIVLGGTTRLLFVNSHLAAGADQNALTRRIWDTNQILSRTKFEPAVIDGDTASGDSESIGDEDFAFWFGDLNFRLDDIPGEDVRRLLLLHTRNEYDVLNKSKRRIDSELGYINALPDENTSNPDPEQNDGSGGTLAKDSLVDPPLNPEDDPASLITTIKSLLKHDQLHGQQRQKKVFHDGWREGDIGFLPTYKYDIGSVGMFDSGEKRRSPSWCDRILYRTRKDLVAYHERTKQEVEARKRDEEMKAKGLDSASAEQEILFNYDPATDGADEYDEYDEGEDAQEVQSAAAEDGHDDTITLEDYIAHPRVLSSDHKPLSAVFNLTYDAVIPELRTQVQQEVARMLDKNENETRPNVTLVIDNPTRGTANADRPTGGTELNCVEFGEVRYLDPNFRALDIANTGPISATFAFIDRPVDDGAEKGPFPSWVDVKVHHESEPAPKELDDLGTSTRFTLAPGEIATVEITVNVGNPEFVRALNAGTTSIDDILVLRILNGRDHFITLQGFWQPSCFYRYLDELVRFPDGVRSLQTATTGEQNQNRQGSATIYHSAPRELFELTETLPSLVERAIADWTMINHDKPPPWESNTSWPFTGGLQTDTNANQRSAHSLNLREALDIGKPLIDHFDPDESPLGRVELTADLFVSFVKSLRDGIVPTPVWQVIEGKLAPIEKSKNRMDDSNIHETVMDALSTTPVHSVVLTFVIFMLNRIITELSSGEAELEQVPVSPTSRRARSSTEASEAPSDISITSTDSTSTRLSFLPSLPRRKTGTASPAASPTTPSKSVDKRAKYIEAFSGFFANILIRAENDSTARTKEKKILDSRKRRVLVALLDSPPM